MKLAKVHFTQNRTYIQYTLVKATSFNITRSEVALFGGRKMMLKSNWYKIILKVWHPTDVKNYIRPMVLFRFEWS